MKAPRYFRLMVDNKPGVLTRITSLIRREGWNILTLTVGETPNSQLSMATICLLGVSSAIDVVLSRCGRLDCVKSIEAVTPENSYVREMLLMRFDGPNAAATAAGCAVDGDGVYSYVGTKEELDALVEKLKPLHHARSGAVCLPKGE